MRQARTARSLPPSAEAMLADLAAALGNDNLTRDPAVLARAETATFATDRRILAIARPADRSDVQACLRLANRHRVPLYPVSRGRNWGYGSRVPTADGAVLLSLERLADIQGYDERLGVVSVGPGVSFRQLRDFLRAQGSELMLNAPGSTPEASIVGNTVERGIVQGPRPDRAATVCGFEVVLPDGDCVSTGMAALAESAVAQVQRWGLGPSLDGLFLQSNLGIVTRMTLWLQPLPACFRHLHFSFAEGAAFDAVVDALQALRREGSVATSIGLHNADKILTLSGRYPFEASAGITPLPDGLRRGALAALGGGDWYGELAIQAATEPAVEGLRVRIDEAIGPLVEDLHWSGLNAPGPFFRPLSDGDETAGAALRSSYWRKPAPPPDDPDPDRDACGVIWHAAVVPFRASDLRRCVEIVERQVAAGGFEPGLSLQALDPRCVYAVVSILYDRDVAGEDERAAACYHALSDALSRAGFPPYRLGLLGQSLPPALDPETRALLHRLKRELDPNGILAPGRYDFGA